MTDILGPSGTPTAADFGIRVNDPANPDTWSVGPAPTVSVRAGAGVVGSDRVTLIWADNAIENRWIEVTVKAGGNTGLAADDVFYFASSIGDCNGDGVVDINDHGVLVGEFGRRGGVGALASDLNGDGRSSLSDFALVRANLGNSVGTPTIPAPAPAAAPMAAIPAVGEPRPAEAGPVSSVIGQPLGAVEEDHAGDANDGPIVSEASTPIADLLIESLSADEYVSKSQAIAAVSTQLAATAEYDLRPLSDDSPAGGDGDDLLTDVLAESAVTLPL